jgi:hypothetical protein
MERHHKGSQTLKIDTKHSIKRILNNSLGKAVRSLDAFVQSGRVPEKNTVLSGIQNYAIQSSVDFAVNNLTSALVFPSKQDLWKYAYKMSPISKAEGNLKSQEREREREFLGLEFGVYKGSSISFFANLDPEVSWFGFDSFIGLQEDWSGTELEKGFFSLNGVIPQVPKNVELVPGWFTDTLPKFLKGIGDNRRIGLLHLDADTYSPTIFVLESLKDFLVDDAVIIFDEFFGYSGWQQHEVRAWNEFAEKYSLDFEYIAMSEQNVAIRLQRVS